MTFTSLGQNVLKKIYSQPKSQEQKNGQAYLCLNKTLFEQQKKP